MSTVFPSSTYAEIPVPQSTQIRGTVQGASASAFAEVLNHQVEWRALRSTTKMFQPAAVFGFGIRTNDPDGLLSTPTVTLVVSPRAQQLWVWIDGIAGSATWQKSSQPPSADVTLWDVSSATKIDNGYTFSALDGTVTEQFAGVSDAGIWDQRILFSGDNSDIGSGAPRRLDIPSAYRGLELRVEVAITSMRLRSITVAEAFQVSTEQEL